jgi:Holliday junction resolvase RusA-like endonuclease
MISFIVPHDPVPKARPRFSKGRTHTDPKTQRAEQLVVMAARRAKVRPISGPVVVWLDYHRKTHIRCDLDNLAKLTLDALNKIAWLDDSQVVALHVTKALGSPSPRTEVRVESAARLVMPVSVNAWDDVHENGMGEAAVVNEGVSAGRAYLNCKP